MSRLIQNCEHCWHLFTGPIMMVIRPGFILQQCCHCEATRQVHQDHAGERRHRADGLTRDAIW